MLVDLYNRSPVAACNRSPATTRKRISRYADRHRVHRHASELAGGGSLLRFGAVAGREQGV
eukprot:scaffold77731_cov51-Phaeocystis_antarctica.AAC.2